MSLCPQFADAVPLKTNIFLCYPNRITEFMNALVQALQSPTKPIDIFAAISGGYVSDVLSCRMQNLLKKQSICPSYHRFYNDFCIYYVRRWLGL